MAVLDAKILNTTQGLETYYDKVKNIDVIKVQGTNAQSHQFEAIIKVEYLLLREEKFYDREKNYFGIRMDLNTKKIVLFETTMQSLFAVKTEEEREATKKLIGEWLINTQAFKTAIQQKLKELKASGHHNTIGAINFLKHLIDLNTQDIKDAEILNNNN